MDIILSNPGNYSAHFYDKLNSKIPHLMSNVRNLRKTIMNLIVEAEESIDIMAPFQSDIDSEILEELIESLHCGIEIRIITRYSEDIDAPFDKGILSDVTKHFDCPPNTIKLGSIHAKMIIKDKNEAYFGSGELMVTSLRRNLEIGTLTSDSEILDILNNIFDVTWELAD